MSECSEGTPFQVSKRRPLLLIEPIVNGGRRLNFAVDTGASVTVVSRRVAKNLGLGRSGRPSAKAVSAGGQLDATFSKLKSLRIGTVEVTDVDVAIMNLSAISRAIGLRLDGIVGYNVLKNYRVTIDYPSRLLFLGPSLSPQSTAGDLGT